MIICYRKNQSETIERKIRGYEKVANFYEKNRKEKFQNKQGLNRILNEINLELNKNPKINNLNKLSDLQDRIFRLI